MWPQGCNAVNAMYRAATNYIAKKMGTRAALDAHDSGISSEQIAAREAQLAHEGFSSALWANKDASYYYEALQKQLNKQEKAAMQAAAAAATAEAIAVINAYTAYPATAGRDMYNAVISTLWARFLHTPAHMRQLALFYAAQNLKGKCGGYHPNIEACVLQIWNHWSIGNRRAAALAPAPASVPARAPVPAYAPVPARAPSPAPYDSEDPFAGEDMASAYLGGPPKRKYRTKSQRRAPSKSPRRKRTARSPRKSKPSR
jgi:hypothetical protein